MTIDVWINGNEQKKKYFDTPKNTGIIFALKLVNLFVLFKLEYPYRYTNLSIKYPILLPNIMLVTPIKPTAVKHHAIALFVVGFVPKVAERKFILKLIS